MAEVYPKLDSRSGGESHPRLLFTNITTYF